MSRLATVPRRSFGAQASTLAFTLAITLGLSSALCACEPSTKKSVAEAKAHVQFLAQAADQDVGEVRHGLPEGAKKLVPLFKNAAPGVPDAQAASKALASARDEVQDLRVAKSTFFAVATPDGQILRNDREADDMAGKNLFTAYPGLKTALTAGYVESRGSMKEAAGVRNRDDSQWVAAAPVMGDSGALGVYATGWSWSSYAYRLETALRSKLLTETPEGGKVPLIYVYIVVGDAVYGAPVSPQVNAKAIAELKPVSKLKGNEPFTTELEIEGRGFGLVVQGAPKLGKDVGIAVLRSET
jgi:hypothetical protein